MKTFSMSLALVFVLSFLSSPALAQDSVQWVPSLKEAFKQAKERGSLIFIAMTMEDEASNDAQKEEYKNPAFIKATRNYVCVFANPQINSSIEVEIDGQKVRRCSAAPTVTCDDVRSCFNEVLGYCKNKDSTGAIKMPYHFLMDGKGEVIGEIYNGTVEGGFDFFPGAEMAKGLDEIVRRVGRGLTTEEYTKCKMILAEGEEAKKAGDLKKAAKLFGGIIKANARSALAELAKKHLEKIEETVKAELAEAVAKVDEDPLAAIIQLEQFIEDYEGTESAKSAQATLAELKKRKDVKKLLSRLKKEKEAREKIAEAEKQIEDGDYLGAIATLKSIARKYKGTSAAEKALARVEALENDKEIVGKIRAMEAEKYSKRVLAMGRSYAKNGMKDKAIAEFQKVIDKYPDTSFAEEAKQEIEKLR